MCETHKPDLAQLNPSGRSELLVRQPVTAGDRRRSFSVHLLSRLTALTTDPWFSRWTPERTVSMGLIVMGGISAIVLRLILIDTWGPNSISGGVEAFTLLAGLLTGLGFVLLILVVNSWIVAHSKELIMLTGRQGQVLAVACLIQHDEISRIDDLGSWPRYIGSGSALVAELITLSGHRGSRLIQTIAAHRGLIAWYGRFGFVPQRTQVSGIKLSRPSVAQKMPA